MGKPYLIDSNAIIAATALVHNMELVTRNIADFDKLPGLDCTNPHFR